MFSYMISIQMREHPTGAGREADDSLPVTDPSPGAR
jgi:hypothetical protein